MGHGSCEFDDEVRGLICSSAISSFVDDASAVFDAYWDMRWELKVMLMFGEEKKLCVDAYYYKEESCFGMYVVVCSVMTDLEC